MLGNLFKPLKSCFSPGSYIVVMQTNEPNETVDRDTSPARARSDRLAATAMQEVVSSDRRAAIGERATRIKTLNSWSEHHIWELPTQ